MRLYLVLVFLFFSGCVFETSDPPPPSSTPSDPPPACYTAGSLCTGDYQCCRGACVVDAYDPPGYGHCADFCGSGYDCTSGCCAFASGVGFVCSQPLYCY